MSAARAEPPRFWEQILQFIEEGRVVPVVGSALLTLEVDGQPVSLYPWLADRLAADLGVEPVEPGTVAPLNAVACNYLAAKGDLEDVYSALKSIMPAPDRLTTPEPLKKLAAITPFKLFVSTTFDPLLARALDEVRFGGNAKTEVVAYSPAAVEDLRSDIERMERPTVFHLFGKLSAVPDYAVTEEDVLEFVHSLQSESKRPQLLFDELDKRQLLIVGSSFSDWLARFFLRTARRERLWTARGKTDVVADEGARGDSGLVGFLQHFSSRTKVFQGGGGIEFVDELHARWIERHPQAEATAAAAEPERPASPLDMVPGAVFLSYASEDREAVRTLRDALERAGVDVWFDRAELSVGDDYEAKIKRNIERCSLFVPVISRQTLTARRRFFRIEWDFAERVAVQAPPTMRFIVPVVIDDTPPDEPSLPERFRRLHWERMPAGQASPEFVGVVRQLFRDYQRSMAAAP